MKTLLIISAFFIASLSWASGTSIGNGGVGIMEGNKLYMLDLYEYSVHDRPAFGNKPIVHWLPARVEGLFPRMDISDSVKRLFTQKVSDIMRGDYYIGHSIVGVAEEMDWRLVNSSLVRLNDDGSVLDPSQFVQVAVRKGVVVFIDREKWNILDDANKVALLIHEALYALFGGNTAEHSRSVTGEYFTPQFLRSGYNKATLAMNEKLSLGKDGTYGDLIFKKNSDITYPLFGYFYSTTKTTSQTPGYFKVVNDGKKFVTELIRSRNLHSYMGVEDFCKGERGNTLHIVMGAKVYDYRSFDSGVYFEGSEGIPKESINKAYPLSRDQKACELDMKRAFQDYETNVLNKEYVSYQ